MPLPESPRQRPNLDPTGDIKYIMQNADERPELAEALMDILDKSDTNPLIMSGGNIFDNTDYLLRKTNKNNKYCILFTDGNISAEKFYRDFLLKFNNLPKDQGFSKDHFDTIQNWFIVNPSYAEKGKFQTLLESIDEFGEVLMLIGYAEGAYDLWQYLLMNKLPIILLDPLCDNSSLDYYSRMSDTQRAMTIINSNSDNWEQHPETQDVLKTIENTYSNFDGSVIKQPGNGDSTASHSIIGQPLFNSNIIIKTYDSILNTEYYEENVKVYDLQFDRYKERYK